MRLLAIALLGACSFGANLTPAPDAAIDAPSLPACFQARCRRTQITIDHTKVVGGPHVKFPLLVQLTDPMLDKGLVFTAADGTTLLPYERERFANGELVAWVRVPSVSSTADTTILLYTGDPAAPDTQDRPSVWDDGFQAVWHLSETVGGVIADSTRNGNHGTDGGGLLLNVAGKVAGATRFDGVDDCIRIPQSTSLASTAATATLGMWVDWTTPTSGTYQRLLLSTNSLQGDLRGMEWSSNAMGFYYYYPSDAGQLNNNYIAMANPFVAGQWHYAVLTQDFSTKTVKVFVDGVLQQVASEMTATMWTQLATAADWYWGGVPPARTRFVGMMDEIRVANVVRSGDWIATEFANQNTPATFYTILAP